ncbi:TFIIF-interacting CTD phosphatase, including NLI-interacting factor (involved in RNA polymerase II regulation) [Plasmopara halstedii]|uniref:TFIIF-interacting CTD phosphatase, including NLI-interacting factor (Involved in RNA polymerase II regulation) n=1 Tax=Plasmopara halstedii TaxID=4781 RepID=A0A0P1B933_PLAHL|nr:TFIIF-interacting CTD phosphatase, including NLI-interacting factor (involved in RNA polymerase II regulation) [Plasmopara halstedii]CEG50486.1 TFIIF-interacting CTD phosphatase, including NLI-interacting factor (involved in RNA polymerase II regulation) [Plasmopara halstedii]|eukprot:XP_024586855.1 TFIIF-interacting CTD phosphatase, including NLI-interacting factor (involved in RNA polymerase II regulation) [Plasmopara halstedii]
MTGTRSNTMKEITINWQQSRNGRLSSKFGSNITLADERTRGEFVLSTKKLTKLNSVNPLATFIHQADRNGKQQPILTSSCGLLSERSNAMRAQQRGSLNNRFVSFQSVFGPYHQKHKQKESLLNSNTIKLRPSLLPPTSPCEVNRKCLILDLDETLVHSSFKSTDTHDYTILIDLDGTAYTVFVCKRPGAENFLANMAKTYEIVVFTASLSAYADPVLNKLDPNGAISYRLYREHCVQYKGNYVKDLSLLNRDISKTILIDNSPMAYALHPRNAIGCSSFINDPNDCELDSIARFLHKIQDVKDVREHLHLWSAHF